MTKSAELPDASSIGVPVPVVNYIHLIKERKSPYYDIVEHVMKEMEMRIPSGENSGVTYTINPRMLQEEIEKKTRNYRLTTTNVCRTLLALAYGSELEDEDFFVTTTSGGRKNYHFVVNNRTLNSMSRMLLR